jgi:hypothetical protein
MCDCIISDSLVIKPFVCPRCGKLNSASGVYSRNAPTTPAAIIHHKEPFVTPPFQWKPPSTTPSTHPLVGDPRSSNPFSDIIPTEIFNPYHPLQPPYSKMDDGLPSRKN